MARSRGKSEVKRLLRQLPGQIEDNLLRGAARAAATVVADEAKARSISEEVAAAVKIATRREDGRIVAKVQVKGPGAYIAPWLEYGTDAHFIAVDDRQRQGMSVGRINRLGKDGKAPSLVINGQFVGTTVFHPGAKAHPFLRPALDAKEAEAIAAAQSFINARVTRSGILPAPDIEDDA